VCMATSGPGAIHLLNGLYDAKLDHQPVVAIVGQQARVSMGSDYQQEVDLHNLFKDVAGAYVQTCMVPAQVPHVIDRAMRIAEATRSPTCVVVPTDVQEERWDPPTRSHGSVFSSVVRSSRSHLVPDDAALEQAAEILDAGERVAILVGRGAIGAADEVERTAVLLGAGVAKALNGRAALPDDLPYVTGSIGLLGTKPSYELMEGCDTLLMVGTNFPYAEWLPEPGQARAVQIDVDARRLGSRYPTEVNLVGDAAETLAALLPRLHRKTDRAWQADVEAGVERWWRILEERATQDAHPINPQRILHELSPRLPDGAILTADSGSGTDWWARHLRVRRGMDAALSGTLASMCPAVPYALAAKLAHPDRPVIAVVGDGAMQMLGNNALIDLAFHRHRWRDQRLVVCVLNNRDLNQVTWEQRVMAGDPKLEASQELPAFDYAAYARLVGLEGIRVEDPDRIGPAWDTALAAETPVVLDVVCDPEVPPLPPHIRSEQAQGIAKALLRGDPGARDLIRHAVKGKLAEFTTR
ncbi:MAG: thiamine pyrophosphate-requiring protein, partial [Solirubrobacteraceae bacterium]